jgi:hypothetical protein
LRHEADISEYAARSRVHIGVDFVWPSVFEIEFAGERFMMQRKACSAAGSIRMPAILTIAFLAVR